MTHPHRVARALARLLLEPETYRHACRVAAGVTSLDQMQVAYLHDVLEDTPCQAADLLTFGFRLHIVAAVCALTRPTAPHDYHDYIVQRVAPDPLAAAVKVLDLQDNMRRCQGAHGGEINGPRFERYAKAWLALTGSTAEVLAGVLASPTPTPSPEVIEA